MAHPREVAIRKKAAIVRIADALGIDLGIQQRDPAVADALLLEAIADSVESQKTTSKASASAEKETNKALAAERSTTATSKKKVASK